MKVHIVCAETDGEHILARFSRYLADQTGWSAGRTPNPKADLNYFLPYLMVQGHESWRETPTAAWFTHYDTKTEGKARLWDVAAEMVDLRLTTAPMYLAELANFGRSALVRPALDRDLFRPAARRVKNAIPVIGVSGMNYPDGRKGEKLVDRLRQSSIGTRFIWKGSGRGWPFQTNYHPWVNMPAFYQSLDILLCTSLIEGIPMPPLEALACGTRVIIPRGVGMLDDVPDAAGIYRFDAGDYASLEAALVRAKEDFLSPTDYERLPLAVKDYSIPGWVRDHEQAFEEFLSPAFAPEQIGDWREKSCAVYVAYGAPARACAKTALTSWKQYMPDVPALLISDAPLGIEDVHLNFPDKDVGARWAKTYLDSTVPDDYEFILYLDADTELVAPVPFLFEALQDGFEFVICRNPDKYHTTRRMTRPDNGDECEATFKVMGYDDLLQFNGGVFAYRRNARTRAFFAAWHREWQKWGKRDQAALLRALWDNPLRMLTLGNEWNTVTHYCDPDTTAGILHYPQSARRHSGMVGRLDSPEAWKAVKK